jgi:hypothetical protein
MQNPLSSERLECQSVVEDIVFSAARWCRYNRNKENAINVLRNFVQDLINGQFWKTSSYAMVYLCIFAPANSKDLRLKFSEYSKGTPPTHPSKPDLNQERNFSQKLLNDDKKTLEAFVRSISNPGDVTEKPALNLEQKRIVSQLLSALESSNNHLKF